MYHLTDRGLAGNYFVHRLADGNARAVQGLLRSVPIERCTKKQMVPKVIPNFVLLILKCMHKKCRPSVTSTPTMGQTVMYAVVRNL